MNQFTRRGVVGVIQRADGRLLVIRRSAYVEAPLAYCFPGGAIEPGETEPEALRRELLEELGLTILPLQRLWECRAAWGVHLSWWLARLEDPQAIPTPSTGEVVDVVWLGIPEILALPDLLSTNRDFLFACRAQLERATDNGDWRSRSAGP